MQSLSQTQKDVLKSYGHKLLILLIAVLGYASVAYLGKVKESVDAHKKKEWVVRPKLLEDIVRVTVTDPETDSVLKSIKGKTVATSYSSREALTEAVQQLAEAQVWGVYRTEVEKNLREMRKLALQQANAANADATSAEKVDAKAAENKKEPPKDPEKAKEEFERYADLVAREEAYARAQAIGVRQQIQAAIAQLDPPAEEKKADRRWDKWMNAIANEKSHLYVVYEIAWYASLLFGVLATSYLFLILLTALPITSGEGYWTARLNKVLERVPSFGGGAGTKGAMVLAAALGGVAAAPPIQATVPGGQADSKKIVQQAPFTDARVIDQSRTHYELERAFPTIPNYDDRLQKIQTAIAAANSRADLLVKNVAAANAAIAEARATLDRRITDVAAMAGRMECQIDAVDVKIVNAEQGIFETKEQTRYVELNHADLVNKLGTHDTNSTEKLNGIAATQANVTSTLGQNTNQYAVRDPRGFWARAFGRTYFQVSLMTPSLARSRQSLSPMCEMDREFLAAALAAMPKTPFNRRDFETELRLHLNNVMHAAIQKAKDAKKTPLITAAEIPARVDDIVDEELDVLLQLTSVPRT